MSRPPPSSSPAWRASPRAYSDDERAEIAARSPGLLTGGPETGAEHLRSVLDETGADELMVTTPVHGHTDRLRSYELVASVAGRLRRVTPGP